MLLWPGVNAPNKNLSKCHHKRSKTRENQLGYWQISSRSEFKRRSSQKFGELIFYGSKWEDLNITKRNPRNQSQPPRIMPLSDHQPTVGLPGNGTAGTNWAEIFWSVLGILFHKIIIKFIIWQANKYRNLTRTGPFPFLREKIIFFPP